MLVHVCDKCSKIIDNVDRVDIEYVNYEEGFLLPHHYRLQVCPECFKKMFGDNILENIKAEEDNKKEMEKK